MWAMALFNGARLWSLYGTRSDRCGGWHVFPACYLNIWAGIGKWALEGMETRAALVSQEALLQDSPDPYSLARDAYLQRQAFKAEIQVDDYDPEEEEYLDEYLNEGL